MAGSLFGLGAGTPSRFPYKDRPQPSPGVAPSPGVVVRARQVIVFGPGGGIFVYSGTPALGNLIATITNSIGTDPYGNDYIAGVTSYFVSGPFFSSSLYGGQVFFDTGSSASGPWNQAATIFYQSGRGLVLQDTSTHMVELDGQVALAGGIAIYPPSGDVTGVKDVAAINGLLTAGYAVQLLPGTYYVNAVLQLPAGAVIRGASPQQTVVRGVGSLSAVMASTGWSTSANTASQAPIYLSGFTVDANGTCTHGIVSQNFWSYFNDLLCKNSNGGDCFRFDAFGANGTTEITGTAVENHVTNCQFRTPGTGGACFRTHDNISNQHFTDGWLTDCVCQGSGSSATVPLVQIDTLAGWKVMGNHLYGAGVGAMSGQRLFNTRVIGNYIEPWGTSATAGGWNGMSFDGIADGGFGASVISGNTLNVDATTPGNAGSTVDGISCRVTSGNSGGLSITGNTISNPEPVAAKYRGGITLQTQSATATMTAVTTGNLTGTGWTNAVDIILNGGTITHTAGV